MYRWKPAPLNYLPARQRPDKIREYSINGITPVVLVYDPDRGWFGYYAVDSNDDCDRRDMLTQIAGVTTLAMIGDTMICATERTEE